MSITSAINRFLNICIVSLFMIVIILGALASPRYFQSTSNNREIPREITVAATNAKQPDVSRLRDDAGLEFTRDTSKPWIREAMRDPVFRKAVILAGARIDEPSYLDIYRLLDLDDACSETLRELIAERNSIGYEALEDGIAKPGASLADVVNNQVIKRKMEHEEKIASLLGDEKYMLLSEYEQTLPQRNKIKQFRQELEFSGVPMTPDQEMALLPILERFSEGNLQARMQNDMIASFPSNTPRIIEGELDMLREVLSEKQISLLYNLQSREENWRSLNYSWNGIGKRVREAK